MLDKRRPVFLNLLQIRMPATAMASILHRFSGVLLFFALPGFIYLLQLSLNSERGFDSIAGLFDSLVIRVLVIGLLWSLIHHFFAGIRFLLLDVEAGISKTTARATARLVTFGSLLITIVIVGVCL